MAHKASHSYQAQSQRLDEIMAALQAPDLTIDQATELYEEGIKLVTELQAYLKTAENKISRLSQTADEP